MTRLEAWQLYAPGHIRVPERGYLETTLLQRAGERQVNRGRVRLMGYSYELPAPLDQAYDDTKIEVRWDPADLTKVLTFGFDGQPLGWAQREDPISVNNPSDLAAHNARKREKRQTRQILAEATHAVATTDEAAFRAHVQELHEARQQAGIISFPVEHTTEKPAPDSLTADEILSILPAAEAEPEKLTIYGLEI